MKILVELGTIDLEARTLADRRLSPIEARLLGFLATRPDQPIDRGTLLQEVWGLPAGAESRTVFATMERLRKKVERDPRHPRHLVTIGRTGYAWRPLVVEPRASAVPTVDTFVGREREIAQVRALLGAGPVTVRGPSGVGKSRLAHEVARLEAERRVWWCGLSGVRTFVDLVHVLGATLELPLRAADPAHDLARIARVSQASGPALWVFDEADEAGEALAELWTRWPTPRVSVGRPAILCTSRRPLRLPDEQGVALDPLPTDRSAGPSAAARLFVSRTAERRRAPYVPSGPELDDVEAAVAALDGVPLAIELAARWTSVLDPADLAKRVRQARIPLEAAPDDPRPAVHRSIEAAMRRSWEELGPELQDALAACGVFPGTFDAAAAEAVIGGEAALERLDALVDRSVLRGADRAGARRLTMLGAIRAFATARLAERPDRALAAERAHGAWYARLGASEALRSLALSAARSDWDRLRVERDNLEAAVDRAAPDDAARAAIAAAASYRVAGPAGRQPEPLRRVLARSDAGTMTTSARVTVLAELGVALSERAPDEAVAVLREGVALARAQDVCVALLVESLGTALTHHGSPVEGEALLAEAIEAHERSGDRYGASVARTELASLHLRQGRTLAALDEFDLTLQVQRALGAAHAEAVNLGNVGVAYLELDRHGLAIEAFEQARALHHRLGNHNFDSLLANNLGCTFLRSGRLDDAAREYHDAIRWAVEQDSVRDEASAHCNLAWLYLERGTPLAAAAHLDRAEALFETQRLPIWSSEIALARAVAYRLLGDEARCGRALDQAHEWIVEHGLGAERLAHERAQRGLLALATGDRAQAEVLLGQAQQHLAGAGATTDAARSTAQLRAGLAATG